MTLLIRMSMVEPELAYKQLILSLQLNFLSLDNYHHLWQRCRVKLALKLVLTLTFLTQGDKRWKCYTTIKPVRVQILDDAERYLFSCVSTLTSFSDEHLKLYLKLAIDAIQVINTSESKGVTDNTRNNPELSP